MPSIPKFELYLEFAEGLLVKRSNATKTSFHFSEKCGTFFSVMETDPKLVEMWYFFSVMETNKSTPLINVCSETSIQQKCIPTAVKKWYFFQLPGMEKNYSTHLINV